MNDIGSGINICINISDPVRMLFLSQWSSQTINVVWIIRIRHEQVISLVWTIEGNLVSGMNKNSSDSSQIINVHEELRGSLPGNIRITGQQLRSDAMTLAGQRHLQCVVSDLTFHFISVKVISVIIGGSLKNLMWSFAWEHVNNSMIFRVFWRSSTGTYD